MTAEWKSFSKQQPLDRQVPPEPPAVGTQPVQGPLSPGPSSTLHGKSTRTPRAGFSTEEEEGHEPTSECPKNNRPEQRGFKMVSNEDDTVPIKVAMAGNSFTCGLYTKSVIPLSPLTSVGPMLM